MKLGTKLSVSILALFAAQNSLAQTQITWQGYKWNVKSASSQGPGPNRWLASNVWVDTSGFLHLKISKVDGKWNCAEIWTDQALSYGTYQCQLEGEIDKLDPNVVMSMFSYQGPDGIKEIDIEYAKWGSPTAKNGWWTVYPDNPTGKKISEGFNFSLQGTYTTSRFNWSKSGVHYEILGGHQAVSSETNLMKAWDDLPVTPGKNVPQTAMPLHFNLWLFQGKPPTDDKPVEVIIHSFVKK
jgi:hypothetical protein